MAKDFSEKGLVDFCGGEKGIIRKGMFLDPFSGQGLCKKGNHRLFGDEGPFQKDSHGLFGGMNWTITVHGFGDE